MVQKPKNRRSRQTRKPVTIDLEASEVESTPDTGSGRPEAEPVAFGRGVETPETATPPIDRPTGSAGAAARDAVEGGERASSGGEQPASAPPPAEKNGRGLSAVGGGLIGGLLALVVAGGLQWAGVLPSLRTAEPVDLSPLQARIESLSADVATLQGAAPAVSEDLVSQVEAAAAATSSNGEAITGLQADFSALDDRLAALNQAVSAGGAGEGAGLETLSDRTAAIEQTLNGLTARLDELGTAGGGVADDDEALRGELETVAQAAASASEGVAALRGEVEPLGEALAEARSRIDAMDERLTGVESDIEAGAGSRVAAAIAASALKSAADRGGGFMSELEAYAAVSADDETVASLRDYAAAGVPTLTQLAERFPDVANRIVAAERGVGPEAGVLDRLTASARSLVQVRPVGEVEGDKPGAIAARMEVALQGGDLSRVVTEWESLPEPAQAASSAFIADARARRELDTLIARVLSGAMSGGEAGANE